MYQAHPRTKSNRPPHPFILSSVAARGRRVRIWDAKHFPMGNRAAVGRDWGDVKRDYEQTNAKAMITLTVLDVIAPLYLSFVIICLEF